MLDATCIGDDPNVATRKLSGSQIVFPKHTHTDTLTLTHSLGYHHDSSPTPIATGLTPPAYLTPRFALLVRSPHLFKQYDPDRKGGACIRLSR